MPEKDLNIPQIKPSIIDPPQIHLESAKNIEGDIAPNSKVKLPKFKFKINSKLLKILGITGGTILAIILIFAILIGIPAYSVYQKSKLLTSDMNLAKEAFKSQDINKVKDVLTKSKTDLTAFNSSYQKLALLKVIPIVSNYYSDGQSALNAGGYALDTGEVVIKTIEPYADIIGFTAGAAKPKDGGESANQRIDFLIKTINDVLPKLDEISQKAKLAQAEINKIDAARYPQNFRGIKIQEKIREVQTLMDEATQFISQGQPLLKEAPYLLGKDSPRTYLVLFQNDKELRPTGGFITGYSVMKVVNGKFEPVSSNDIYNLDSLYSGNIAAPDPMIKYLKGPYVISNKLRLRDMNWSPDFKTSMDSFATEAKKVGIGNIDGIISVDTQVLVKLLNVIGVIGVPGFGNYSTQIDARCNCPQVIYELESFADIEGPVVWSENEPGKIVFAPPNYDNRKKILGPLMNSIMANAFGQPKAKLPQLFQAAWESLTEKHILFYSLNSDAQKAAEEFNIAGRLKDYTGDYLEINDANLGGRKSNLYVTQEVVQNVSKANDGSLTVNLEITYKNTQSQDGWLNSVLPSYVRVYVPKDSQLISTEGFEDKTDPYEDLGKTVFAGLYRLRPLGVSKLTLKYKLPFKVTNGRYDLLIQKQPGLDAPNYTVQINRQSEEFQLKTDREFHFKI
ncbi:MAG: DUF4012 domain-containing protein [Candidatus Woesebacteria bacterium]|nr:MAG: DUF4012 domain-containing protein [Candidatus Woesebacteria bacterium]